jgi:hypothetical protein
MFQELAASGVQVFKELNSEYTKLKEESSRYHSRSILVHKVQELLKSASNSSMPRWRLSTRETAPCLAVER